MEGILSPSIVIEINQIVFHFKNMLFSVLEKYLFIQ